MPNMNPSRAPTRVIYRRRVWMALGAHAFEGHLTARARQRCQQRDLISKIAELASGQITAIESIVTITCPPYDLEGGHRRVEAFEP